MNKPIKVIYITAYSRSGSTLLDIILGNIETAFSTGELGRLALSGWLNNEICSCKAVLQDCLFWAEVKHQWENQTGGSTQEYLHLQDKFERLRRLPRLLQERKKTSPEFQRYAELTTALLRIISSLSDKEILIDSTKSPMRGLALSLMPEIDLTFIHLVRDVRGVAWSLFKSYAKAPEQGIETHIASEPAYKTAISWNMMNVVMNWVRASIKNSNTALIKYEDLVDTPHTTIKTILQKVKIDDEQIQPLIDKLQSNKELCVAPHIVAGNRLRMKNTIMLQKDQGWTADMPIKMQKSVMLLSKPVLKKLGYPI